jgi:hypothetical protein
MRLESGLLKSEARCIWESGDSFMHLQVIFEADHEPRSMNRPSGWSIQIVDIAVDFGGRWVDLYAPDADRAGLEHDATRLIAAELDSQRNEPREP